MRAGSAHPGARRRDSTGAVALAAYLLVAFLYFGVRVVLRSGGETYVGSGPDPQSFIWSFAWWPHAILHGENPFVTHAIWAPDGVNLTWATSVPGLALLFSPLTLLFGAVTSYNVAAVLTPALAAWTGFLLCRHVTHATWPSLVGGYLFGFSSYMLGQNVAHPHVAAVFLVPLVALVVLRFIEGDLSGRGLAVRLGPLLALQLSFSTEVAFTLGLALACGLVLAFVVAPGIRVRVLSLVRPLAGAFALAAALSAPFLYYALTGFQSKALHPPEHFVADLLNLVVPTRLEASGRSWADSFSQHFTGNDFERGAFFGVPALVIVVWFACVRWRSPGARFLLAAFALAMLAAFGAWLRVDGDKLVPLPWGLVESLPLFNNVLPVRLALYASLAVAVIVAIWAASSGPPRWLRTLLPALAVLALVPDPGANVWASTVNLPSFFTSGDQRRFLCRGENILPLPVSNNGYPMLWQVESGFWFRMAGGYLAEPPPSFEHPPSVAGIAHNAAVPADQPELVEEYIRLKNVTAIVVDEAESSVWRPVLDKIGTPYASGGVLLYRVGSSGPPPGCGSRAGVSVS